eukprot:jgi/Ulvmu1/2512/UM138_0016.1
MTVPAFKGLDKRGDALPDDDAVSLETNQQEHAKVGHENSGEATGHPVACVFSSVLGETFTRSSGFKELYRRLETIFPDRRSVEAKSRDGPSGYASLSKALAADSGMAVLVLGNPSKSLSIAERQKLVDFIVDGGNLVVAAGDGGFKGSNINDMLQLFGISVNADSVLRLMIHKYYHPKEALIPDGVVNRAITQTFSEQRQGKKPSSGRSINRTDVHRSSLDMPEFVYPYGCTLSLEEPAIALLSSGIVSCPPRACVAALSQDMTASAKCARGMPLVGEKVCKGRVLVVGSAAMFGDSWLDKESNEGLMRCLFTLVSPEHPPQLDATDAQTPNVKSKALIPDIATLSSRPRGCLDDAMQLPPNPADLFERTLFSLNLSLVPEAAALYRKLGVPKRPLSLIEPQFEQPLPPLTPSVFPPRICEPSPPRLERFDLDDAFANEFFKVTQLTLTAQRLSRKARSAAGQTGKGGMSKAEAEKEYAGVVEDYVSKAAQAISIPGGAKMSPQQALLQVFDAIAKWKLQSDPMSLPGAGAGIMGADSGFG